MAGILDLFGFGGAGQDPASQLALQSHDDTMRNGGDAPTSGAQATPSWPVSFGDPTNGDKLLTIGPNSDAAHDSEIDPDTGVTKGFLRRENNKSALQASLMLLAAGLSTDDSSRAQLLSQLPNAMDNSTKVQNFARMRLDLARARLAQAQADQASRADAAFAAQFGPGGGGVSVPQGAPPVAAMPPAGPMAPVIGPAATGAAASRLAAGQGNAADTAIVNGAAAPQGAQPAPQPQMAPPAAPTSVLGGPGGVTLPSKAPPTMDIPANLAKYVPTPQESDEIYKMGREKGMAEFARRQDALANQEYVGAPVMLEGSNQINVPIYQHGSLKGYKEVGAGTVSASIEKDPNTGDNIIVARDARGNKTSITPYDGANQKLQEKMDENDLTQAQKNSDTLKGQYATLQNDGQKYARATQAIQDIDNGKVDSGPTSGIANYVRQLKENTIGLTNDEKQILLSTTNANSLTSEIVGKLAKANNGTQVTDADVRFAQSIVAGGGTPPEVKAALQRYTQDLRNEANAYNSLATDHNSRIGDVKAGPYAKGGLKVKTIEGDFGTSGDENTPAYATPESGTVPAPNQRPALDPASPLGMLATKMNAQPAQPAYSADQIAAARAELARRRGGK